jgi:glyoxylase-like metal-dependent hydrolase (beta-lactamase superfamily II)
MLHQHAAEGIHRIDEASTNWYLVEDGGRLTVVDTGFPRSWDTLQHALRALGRSPSDIDAVVLTHAHFDHMGFAERARTKLGVPVWAHEREVPVTEHPWRFDHERSRLLYARHPGFLKVFAAMGAKGALWVKGAKAVRTYGDDEQLDVPGRPRVVFTPGHTHGHCALHFPERGAVIAGDAFVTLNPYTGGMGPADRRRRGDRGQRPRPGVPRRPRGAGRNDHADRPRRPVDAGHPRSRRPRQGRWAVLSPHT